MGIASKLPPRLRCLRALADEGPLAAKDLCAAAQISNTPAVYTFMADVVSHGHAQVRGGESGPKTWAITTAGIAALERAEREAAAVGEDAGVAHAAADATVVAVPQPASAPTSSPTLALTEHGDVLQLQGDQVVWRCPREIAWRIHGLIDRSRSA